MTNRFLAVLVFALFGVTITAQNSFSDEFKKLAEKPEYKNAVIGVQVADAETGEELFSFQPGKLMIPASVLKIVTSSTALEVMGAGYRFKTRIGYTGSIQNGVLKGNLVVISGGDPSLGSMYFPDNHFAGLWAEKIRQSGISKIEGDIVFDGSDFYAEELPPTWIWGDMGNYFGAYFNPFTNHDNLFQISFKSGKSGELTEIVSTTPEIEGLKIENRVFAAEENRDNANVFGSPFDKNRIVKGTIPCEKDVFTIKASLPDPIGLLGTELKAALQNSGISFTGNCKQSVTSTNGFKEIYDYYSPALSEIVKALNYESVNLFAEHLLVQLGLVKKGKGNRESGIEVIKEFWNDKGFETSNLYMEDGSGLSHFNAVTPEFLNRVLVYMAKSENSSYFVNSLPAAGEGTLVSFDHSVFPANSLRAKSGSMTRVRCYAGYLTCQSNRKVVFTIMVNQFGGSQTKIRKETENLLQAVKNIF